ncbi:Dabb family protein [candidate division KSB1 bacterium]|nr:MAG: Dabb family protein [candidate division KSB1 bacterium]
MSTTVDYLRMTRNMLKKMTRRNFLETSGKMTVLAGALTLPAEAGGHEALRGRFVHHVFFWLKEPDDAQLHERFQHALRDLVTIEAIQSYQLGKPADTRREVIDSSYHYSLLTIFADQAAHDHYQVHPVHDAFRLVAAELCARIVVYDSVDL